MKFSLKLSHQGWLFLIVSLVFELFFFGSMFYLTREAELDSQRYEHRVAVMDKGTKLLVDMYRGAYYLAFYTMSRKDEFGKAFDRTSVAVPHEIEQLSNLANAEERESTRHLCLLLADALQKLNHCKASIDESGDLSLTPLRKELLPTLAGLLRELGDFTELKDTAAQEEGHRREESRNTMQLALASGVVFNVILGIWFMSWFTKKITGKLSVLSDNTVRLASGAPLHSELKGDDEIAQVDHVFHYMAGALEEASRKEKEATEILRASEERVRGIIDHMPVGLIAVDQSGKIVRVNPRTEELYGASEKELAGRHISTLFSGSGADDAGEFMNVLIQRALGRQTELSARRAGGELFPAEISINELQSPQGTLLLASVQDVTQRHEVDRLKREFVAMVSHDLRTPLTSVHGSLTLLSAGALGDLSEEAQVVVSTAENEIERLTRLVNDLLDVAKIEAGKMDVRLQEIAIEPVIRRSVASVSAFAQRHAVSLKWVETSDIVLGDSERLIQVVVNLLSNAIKFSPPDSTVSIVCVSVGNWLEVQVRDQGRGVPSEHLEAIFQRFHQVEGDDATVKKGTGLGLPICKIIVEQHGGTIGVVSQPGAGSKFWFRVPLALAPSAPSNNKDAEAADEQDAASPTPA